MTVSPATKPLITCIDSDIVAIVVGLRPMKRNAESPRPIPQMVRSPNMSFRVANSEARTVQSRVPGLVTIGPTTTRSVAASIWLKMTNGSCQRTWESKLHTWVKPFCSASLVSSTTRDAGGLVCSTVPKSITSLSFRSLRHRSTPRPRYLCWGKPRSTPRWIGSGQRLITTLGLV